jgi:hypothetical protein
MQQRKSYSHAEHKIIIISRKGHKALLWHSMFVQSLCMEDNVASNNYE